MCQELCVQKLQQHVRLGVLVLIEPDRRAKNRFLLLYVPLSLPPSLPPKLNYNMMFNAAVRVSLL